MDRVKSRREEYSEATRTALLDSAVTSFVQRGYSAASLDEITRSARVTKGALYHHFPSKQALFEAVFERAASAGVARVSAAAGVEGTPWERSMRALDAFLDLCCEETHRRLVLEEAPLAMGWQRWATTEMEMSRAFLEQMLRALQDSAEIDLSDSGIADPVPVFARLLHGSLLAAAQHIAAAADRTRAREDVGSALRRLLGGLRPRPS